MKSNESRAENADDPLSSWPDVMADIELGRTMAGKQIDWDVEAITDYLRQRGLKDEQIRETAVTFLAPFGKKHCEIANKTARRLRYAYRMGKVITYGTYNRETGEISAVAFAHEINETLLHELEHRIEYETIPPEDVLKEEQDYLATVAQKQQQALKNRKKNQILLGGTACLASFLLVKHGLDVSGLSAAITTSMMAAASIAAWIWNGDAVKELEKSEDMEHEIYRASPWEQRARAAEKKYAEEKQLVRITD